MLNNSFACSMVLVAACSGQPKPATTPIQQVTPATSAAAPAAPAAATDLEIWLSNQSFKIPTIDLVLSIDGAEVFRGDLAVGTQHTFEHHAIKLAPGKHMLHAESSSGQVKLDAQFELGADNRFATLMYWHDAQTAPSLAFQQHANQPAFM